MENIEMEVKKKTKGNEKNGNQIKRWGENYTKT